jgi:hypothetical protein
MCLYQGARVSEARAVLSRSRIALKSEVSANSQVSSLLSWAIIPYCWVHRGSERSQLFPPIGLEYLTCFHLVLAFNFKATKTRDQPEFGFSRLMGAHFLRLLSDVLLVRVSGWEWIEGFGVLGVCEGCRQLDSFRMSFRSSTRFFKSYLNSSNWR